LPYTTTSLGLSPIAKEDEERITDEAVAGTSSQVSPLKDDEGDDLVVVRVDADILPVDDTTTAVTNGEYEPRNGHKVDDDDGQQQTLLQKLVDKIGKVDESRIVSSREYNSGEVPSLYSNLEYDTIDGSDVVFARHANKAIWPSSALLFGTVLAAGTLSTPTASVEAGFTPIAIASLVAWAYGTISALLVSELLLNRTGETGRPRNAGLLELYSAYLGEGWGTFAAVWFVVLNYALLMSYVGVGGEMLGDVLGRMGVDLPLWTVDDTSAAAAAAGSLLSNLVAGVGAGGVNVGESVGGGAPPLLFSALLGGGLLAASSGPKRGTVQRTLTHVLVPAAGITLAAATALAATTADFTALLSSENQHPEVVFNAFSFLFVSMSFHTVVPRVVHDLEGDRRRITTAIAGGSTASLVAFLAWNAVVLGNMYAVEAATSAADAVTTAVTTTASNVIIDPVAALRATEGPLGATVATFAALAALTSASGLVLGLANELHDSLGAPRNAPSHSYGPREENVKWKLACLAVIPPALFSVALGTFGHSTIEYADSAVDFAGVFGVSVLFLILPAVMVWNSRYGEDAGPLVVGPMFPLGKITLGSLWKAAGTLIVEQGLEKLGVFDFFQELMH